MILKEMCFYIEPLSIMNELRLKYIIVPIIFDNSILFERLIGSQFGIILRSYMLH